MRIQRFFIIIVFTFISCSKLYFRTKIEYEGVCSINKSVFSLELKKQKVHAKKIELRDFLKYGEQCNCMIMSARAFDWEGVSIFGTDIFFPVIKLNESYYINTFYVDGNLRDGFEKTDVDKYIEDALVKLLKESQYCLQDSLYEEYKNVFRRGVNRSYRGYIFWQ